MDSNSMLYHRDLLDPDTNKPPDPNKWRYLYSGYSWSLLVLPVIGFVIWGEDRSQNALEKGTCNHLPVPKLSEKAPDISKRIYTSLDILSKPVHWRTSLLSGILAAISILFLFTVGVHLGLMYGILDKKEYNRSLKTYPGFFIFLLVTLVIFISIYVGQMIVSDNPWYYKTKIYEEYHDILSKKYKMK